MLGNKFFTTKCLTYSELIIDWQHGNGGVGISKAPVYEQQMDDLITNINLKSYIRNDPPEESLIIVQLLNLRVIFPEDNNREQH